MSLRDLPPEPANFSSVSIEPFDSSLLSSAEAEENELATARAEAFKDPIREWNGQPLHGFSIGRESLWLDLRAAAGAPSWNGLLQDRKSGLQPLLPDAIRILFILTHSQDELKSARRDLLDFEERAAAWAETELPRARAMEAITETLRIYNAAQTNVVELVTEGTGSATRGK